MRLFVDFCVFPRFSLNLGWIRNGLFYCHLNPYHKLFFVLWGSFMSVLIFVGTFMFYPTSGKFWNTTNISRLESRIYDPKILDFLGNFMTFYFICFVYLPRQGKETVKNCMLLRICWCTMVTYVRKSSRKYRKAFELLFREWIRICEEKLYYE